MFRPGHYTTKTDGSTRTAKVAMRDRCAAYVELMAGLVTLDRQTRAFGPMFQRIADGIKAIEPR